MIDGGLWPCSPILTILQSPIVPIYSKADIQFRSLSVRFRRWSQPIDATLYLRGRRWSVQMEPRTRWGFTAAEKAELWDRWQRGESLKAIGRAFGKPSSSIYHQLSPYGGIRPAARRRSRLALTLTEREEISRGIAAQQSIRSIAKLLSRSASTVSRECAVMAAMIGIEPPSQTSKPGPGRGGRSRVSWR